MFSPAAEFFVTTAEKSLKYSSWQSSRRFFVVIPFDSHKKK